MGTDIDWKHLGFQYLPTNSHIKYIWRDGQWQEGELVSSPYLHLNIAATALHYGQTAFEGLKAFRGKDDKIRIFRPDMNAARMQRTAHRICMPEVPEEMFISAIRRVIKDNLEYVPPYGTGGALYIRPLLFGSGPQIGINPADEYIFLILVLPVGPYYKGGLKPVRAIVLDEYDRAAPRGVGHIKVGGNYAASLEPHHLAREKGFQVELYLDAAEHKYIDEFGTSNFIAISKDKSQYITPDSPSILPSVTNNSLQTLAEDAGLEVVKRSIAFDELDDFSEIGACGTAVVLTPVNEIVRGERTILVDDNKNGCGPVLQKLYDRVTAIQYGEKDDYFGWTYEL